MKSLRYAVVAVACSFNFILVASAQVQFFPVEEKTIQERVEKAKGNNSDRKTALLGLFNEVGCGENLREQPVRGAKLPNIICILPGETDSFIIVGAHFDRAEIGNGVIDNWSGASLLPSLYESLKLTKRKHTYIFVGFTDEEKGLVGSQFYVKDLKKSDLSKIKAMVNLDSLGAGETEIWVSVSDKKLVNAIAVVARAMKLPVTRMDIENGARSDSEAFREKKIAAIDLHSLTQETFPFIHSPKDTIGALKPQQYYSSYRLIAGYLAYLDGFLTTLQP